MNPAGRHALSMLASWGVTAGLAPLMSVPCAGGSAGESGTSALVWEAPCWREWGRGTLPPSWPAHSCAGKCCVGNEDIGGYLELLLLLLPGRSACSVPAECVDNVA